MPTKIEATYRVVTPMFCAGADPRRAELRVPSFKGVLRFWWRALAWSRLGGDLRAIQQQEDCLFGSARGGQSSVTLRVDMATHPTVVSAGDRLTSSAASEGPVGEGARYLGYGVMLTRACLRAPFDFTIRMRSRGLSDSLLETLEQALIAAGVFGGMGARSRKGYGSLNLLSLRTDEVERWRRPHSFSDLQNRIETLRRDGSRSGSPEFTAFSQGTRHLLLESDSREPMALLDRVGRELVRYRSWGHNGKVFGTTQAERNFPDDHDLMKRRHRDKHPRRIAFGLPHNYGKQQDQQVGPSDKFDRRSSPLFIHIHQCSDALVAVLSFLPARFLPGNIDISVGSSRVSPQPEAVLYCPIHDFLDRLLDPNQCKEPLQAVEVKW